MQLQQTVLLEMFARQVLFILHFLPINGRDWVRESRDIIGNMTPQEAALFAKEIDCTTVIPTHYDMMRGNEENPLLFAYIWSIRSQIAHGIF